MIYLNLPVGVAHGWGVCGKSIAREISKLAPTRLLTDPFTAVSIGDELDYFALRKLLPSDEEARALASLSSSSARLAGPLLQLASKQLQPMHAILRGMPTLGYCFFEDTELLPSHLENAKHFDRLTTGSSWCTEILRRHGIANVETVLQGVDPTIFFPLDPPRSFFPDHFIVFSGGKFEFRKGQDLVIRAFKELQDRHRDVLLVASWFNAWGFSVNTMSPSKHIRFGPRSRNSIEAIAQVLADNGIDLSRVILLGPRAQQTMPHVYRNSDVGLFPNRAEGGTNLVLMEYMACGKPVIATASTGHADVVTPEAARIIETRGEVTSSSDGESVARWPEPDLEQTIEQLEWAYQNRDALKPLADAAAGRMKAFTWSETARRFHQMLTAP